jgi:sodium pump decarboxylase gamma subunit
MVLLAVTTDTWIVTGLGFGIVLALLFCLVYIMQLFGWTMQKVTAPAAPKAEPTAKPASGAPAEDEKAAIAMALSANEANDEAAVAYALYLYQGKNHDIATATIAPQARLTAWNDKSIGLNNKGF